MRGATPPQVASSEPRIVGPDATGFDHSILDGLLRDLVDTDGYVDYDTLSHRREELQRYLQALAAAPLQDLGRDETLALLINAYNAFTLELIVEHWPLGSIREIAAEDRWDAVRWNIAGNEYSLNQIEHERIRSEFREPRIHWALVCAAVSCPPLRREAYTGARLNEQLEDQARRVHHGDRWIRYRPGSDKIELTRIYDWYGDDFRQTAGSILDYVARYRDELDPGDPPKISFLDYDWSLNDQPER